MNLFFARFHLISIFSLAFAVIPIPYEVYGATTAVAHCCATESHQMQLSSANKIELRFAIYREAGFDMLRVEGLDDSIISPDGHIRDPKDLAYLQLARNSGFRLKVNIHTLDQPEWYLNLHPGSRLVNEEGTSARGEMSFWYPQLHQRVLDGTEAVFRYISTHGLFHHVDLIAPDFGLASEPIYPAAWTQAGGAQEAGEAFWFYAPNAQADFAAKMKVLYGTIAAANASWGTNFAGFSTIVIPKPGALPGPFWRDVLVWYRDTKRAFVIFQIENFKREMAKYPEAHGIKLLLYVPGTHCSRDDWTDAITTGSGRPNIRIMCDSEFLLETARYEGCDLQYTGCENESEVQYLQSYLADHQIHAPLWGENSENSAPQINHLADVVISDRLAGLDYTHTSSFFEADLTTPNFLLPQITGALARIHRSFGDSSSQRK